MRARWRRVTETSSEASCSSAVRAREASRKAASIINLGVLMPRRLAAAAMLRLVAAGIRRDVGETLVKLMRYKCSAFSSQSSFIGCITTKNPTCNAPRSGENGSENDADIHISLVVNVIRCQPLPRFETGVRIHVGTPDFQEPYQ